MAQGSRRLRQQKQGQAGAADLPMELVERMLTRLPVKDRARCGLVCCQWLAASRRPALWQTVHWDSHRDSVAQLLWLGGRSGVQHAHLWVTPRKTQLPPAVAFCLGAWAASLQRLSLVYGRMAPVEGLDCLGGLQQLTWLWLYVGTPGPPRDHLACLSALRRLAVLDWDVGNATEDEGEDSDEEGAPAEHYHLPALPASLQHLRIRCGCGMVLADQLPALTRLQALLYDQCYSEDMAAAISSLRSLTALVLRACELGELPTMLSALTSLRYLDLGHCNLCNAAGTEILQQLRCLPRLEWLRLHCCSLQSLAPLAGAWPPLRALEVSGNLAATLGDMGFLATLEYLDCHWTQVPPAQACAAAPCLKTVVLWAPGNLPATSAQPARALASLAALPALEVLHFNPRCLKWSHDVVAALQALQRARPQLAPLAEREPATPWRDVKAVFEFQRAG